jgi:hypothetical protein
MSENIQMSSDNGKEILLCGGRLYSKIFHYNNGFLHEFIDKNFQL